jgi:hypothetical protein
LNLSGGEFILLKTIKSTFLATILSVLMLLSMFIVASPSVLANAVVDSVQVTIGNAINVPGSDIEVPINFSNITSIANLNNCDFTITYDNTKLTLVEVTPGDIIKVPTTDISYNDVQDLVTKIPIGQINFLFNDESLDNSKYITDSGTFAIMKFHIKDNVATGSTFAINMNTVGSFSLSDLNLTIREANFTNGIITVNMPAIIPNAPIAAIVDDARNLFGWTNNPQYTNASDYEYSVDNGQAWVTCTANPQPIKNENYPIGTVKVRVKADLSTNRSTGSELVSTNPFTKLKYGDLNNDGFVTSTDYGILKSVLLKKANSFPNGVSMNCADFNGDGFVTSTDYGILKSVLLKKATKFPVEH